MSNGVGDQWVGAGMVPRPFSLKSASKDFIVEKFAIGPSSGGQVDLGASCCLVLVAETYLTDPMFFSYPPLSVGVTGCSNRSTRVSRVVVSSLKRGAPCTSMSLLYENYRFGRCGFGR